MRRWAPFAALVLLLMAALVVASRGSGHETTAQHVQRIAQQVRCPQCEGLSAAESDAPAAQAVRQAIADRLGQGQSDGRIKAFLADKYGQDILLRPPASGVSGLVWALPVMAFLAAAAWLAVLFARWHNHSYARPTDDDQVLVARARARRRRAQEGI
jgi:cytochrome c-type biogenesis protein CcmH